MAKAKRTKKRRLGPSERALARSLGYRRALADIDTVWHRLTMLNEEMRALRGEFSALIYTMESKATKTTPRWAKVTRRDIELCLKQAEGKLNG